MHFQNDCLRCHKEVAQNPFSDPSQKELNQSKERGPWLHGSWGKEGFNKNYPGLPSFIIRGYYEDHL